MKNIFLASLIIFSFSLNAQNSNFKHRIGLNIGSSSLGYTTNVWIKDGSGLVKKAYATPVMQLSYTYMLGKRFGFGGAVAYQKFYLDLLPLDAQSSAAIMNVNRTNFTVHAKFYYINNKRFDLYSGVRLGGTFWNGNISFQQLYDYLSKIIPPIVPESFSNNMLSKIVPSKVKFAKTFFSGQFNFGADVFFTNNIGVKMELAVGAPYWALAGLNIRL